MLKGKKNITGEKNCSKSNKNVTKGKKRKIELKIFLMSQNYSLTKMCALVQPNMALSKLLWSCMAFVLSFMAK